MLEISKVKGKSEPKHARRVVVVSGAVCLLALTAAWARWDYKQWLLLGKGGLPSTCKGWLRVTAMRLQARDPFATAHLETTHRETAHLDVAQRNERRGDAADIAMISNLAPRNRARPRVGAHPVPHRQLDQRIPTALSVGLQQVFDEEVSAHADTVEYALSYFEKHTLAITCRPPLAGLIQHGAHAEIAHVHALDGSMHMVLSPRDAVLAVRAGWAELHGLAGKAMNLPATYVMVYAPQKSADLGAIRTLLRAAIAYRTANAGRSDR